MMNTHLLCEYDSSIHDLVAGFFHGGIVDGFIPADGVADYFPDNELDEDRYKKGNLRSRGPSFSVIPKEFPPFL
jgi:hypothetical protein